MRVMQHRRRWPSVVCRTVPGSCATVHPYAPARIRAGNRRPRGVTRTCLDRLMPPDQLAAAVLPGRLPEAGLEDPGEVGHVLEAPAPGDRLHPALGQRRVLQVTAAVVQPAFPYPAGDRRALLVEQLVQVQIGRASCRETVSS